MIIGLGADAVELERFAHWSHYSHKRLLRIFTQQEIAYCLADAAKSNERFAARFAAKEAFFKAASSFFDLKSLLAIVKFVEIVRDPAGPVSLRVDWERLNLPVYDNLRMHLSLTHTKIAALAVVILELV